MADRKKCSAKVKFSIVMQGFRGNLKISELCNAHGFYPGGVPQLGYNAFIGWRQNL